MKAIRYIRLTALPAIALLLAGCNKDSLGGPATEQFTIRLEVPGTMESRGLPTESVLETADLLIFEESGSQELFVKRIPIDAIGNSEHYKTFQASLPLSPTARYRLVVLANARNQIISSPLTPGTEKETLLESLTPLATTGSWDTDWWYIPMWGETSELLTLSSVSTPIPTIQLIRTLVRIDVAVAEELLATNTFDITEVQLHNTYTQARIVPEADKYLSSALRVTAASIPSGANILNAAAHYYPTAPGEVAGKIFIAEHDNLENGSDRLMMFIGGTYQGNPQPLWYTLPLDEIAAATGGQLLRNHRYRITITAVTGEGSIDPDAIMNALPKLSIDVVPWSEYDLQGGELNASVTLSASKTVYNFDNADGRMATGTEELGGYFMGWYYYYDDHKIDIETNAVRGWHVSRVTDEQGNELTGDACWTTLKQGYLHFISTAAGSTTSDENQWVVWAKPNTKSTPRKAYIYVAAETREMAIEVSQAGMHDCGQNGKADFWGNDYPVRIYVDSVYTQTIRCWMTENLHDIAPGSNVPIRQIAGELGYLYSSAESSYDPYCPPGWSPPTFAEAAALTYTVHTMIYDRKPYIEIRDSYPEDLEPWANRDHWEGGSMGKGYWLIHGHPFDRPGHRAIEAQVTSIYEGSAIQLRPFDASGSGPSPDYPLRCIKKMEGWDKFYSNR